MVTHIVELLVEVLMVYKCTQQLAKRQAMQWPSTARAVPNGASRRVPSGDFWAGHVQTWQHLDNHSQPREICALEAKYPRIEQLFFLAEYFFFPAKLTVTGIDSLGAARSPIPGNPRRSSALQPDR